MRSIGARLSIWYATAATATLTCLFVAGYYMLHSYLIDGLDLLNKSEFEQIRAHLGPDYSTLTAHEIDRRIRETTELASVLFYIDVHGKESGTVFYSNNLHGQSIPDVKGLRRYDVDWLDAGKLRVGEFVLPPYDVIIATPERQVIEVMEGYTEVSGALVAVMLAISVFIGVGLSRYALRPVRLISETASRIGSDNLGDRIPVPAVQDEISALVQLLNAMFDRLQASFQNVRRFAADASHELKTPLSLVRLHAEKILASGHLDATSEEEMQSILEELARLNATIDDLLFLSRAESRAILLELAPHDPTSLLRAFGADAQVLAEHHHLHFAWSHTGSGTCLFEPRSIRRVLLNLLSNAVHVSPPGGSIHLDSVLGATEWNVSLVDEGSGVPANEREHIFDRFVRLAPADGTAQPGSGLGLAICRSIIELHGGQIHAGAGPEGKGLCVSFSVPRTGSTLAVAASTSIS
ncbi:MAG: two-component system, OmpR family, heavy metal sensor histidine kinase [Pseudomonadota bacterium]|jgi:two-component system heavy metal sensor histidine kinase CusS